MSGSASPGDDIPKEDQAAKEANSVAEGAVDEDHPKDPQLTGDNVAAEDDIQPAAGRTVAFPPDEIDHGLEEKPTGGLGRPRGVEMRRELTKEERELAQAGYDHLEEQRTMATAKGDESMENVDIEEHTYKFETLENTLDTNFDSKDPVLSRGLEPKDAAKRLAEDGPNILTPPKKKGALRKVRDIS